MHLHSIEDECNFKNEVVMLAKVCHHPSIVDMLGADLQQVGGSCLGRVFLEYASAGDTLDWLRKHGPMSEGARFRMPCMVASTNF